MNFKVFLGASAEMLEQDLPSLHIFLYIPTRKYPKWKKIWALDCALSHFAEISLANTTTIKNKASYYNSMLFKFNILKIYGFAITSVYLHLFTPLLCLSSGRRVAGTS